MEHIKKLRKIYKQGRLLPFIGAGVSMSLEWKKEEDDTETRKGPSWSELVDKASKLLGFEDPDLIRFRGSDLQILEYFKLLNDGKCTELTNWLVKELNPPKEKLRGSQIHQGLANLENCKTFYTTNFDTFLEDSFSLLGRGNQVIAKEADMHKDMSNECEIVKFHGDLNNPDMLVLSEADYEKRLTLSSSLDYKLMSDLLNRTVLFLGYSFSDPNVSYIFRKINDQFKEAYGINNPKGYIVIRNPSNFEKELFNSRNIEIIPAETDDLTSFVSDLLHQIKS